MRKIRNPMGSLRIKANSNLDVERGYSKYYSRRCYVINRSKYNQYKNSYSIARGGKREDLGMYFRSSWEANWARYLNFQKKHGAIVDWEYEPETFEFEDIKRGSRYYTPDFKVYNPDGSVEFHEIKGYMDRTSQTKLKRMNKYYPDVKIIIVGKKEYSAVSKKAKGFIPNWEIIGNYV